MPRCVDLQRADGHLRGLRERRRLPRRYSWALGRMRRVRRHLLVERDTRAQRHELHLRHGRVLRGADARNRVVHTRVARWRGLWDDQLRSVGRVRLHRPLRSERVAEPHVYRSRVRRRNLRGLDSRGVARVLAEHERIELWRRDLLRRMELVRLLGHVRPERLTEPDLSRLRVQRRELPRQPQHGEPSLYAEHDEQSMWHEPDVLRPPHDLSRLPLRLVRGQHAALRRLVQPELRSGHHALRRGQYLLWFDGLVLFGRRRTLRGLRSVLRGQRLLLS